MKEQREGFRSFMGLALEEARAASDRGEVPVGAVVVQGETVLARAGNRTRELSDPTAHAEMLAIREACAALGSERLVGCDLYVTLEPCPMCAPAIAQARIDRLVFGAYDPGLGAAGSVFSLVERPEYNHRVEVIAGVMEAECRAQLTAFFADRRCR